MNEQDIALLSRKFPLSKSTLRRNQAFSDGNRTCNPVQEPKAGDSGSKDRKDENPDRAKSGAVDGKGHGGYRLKVVFKLSDRRRRDPTGMLESVADILVRAVRRFREATADGILGSGIRRKR